MSLFDDFLESTQQETHINQDDQKILTSPPKINKVSIREGAASS